MYQGWRHLTFLHRRYPAELPQGRVPAGLPVETAPQGDPLVLAAPGADVRIGMWRVAHR